MAYTIEVSYDDYDPLSLIMATSDEPEALDYAEALAGRWGRSMFRVIMVRKWDLGKATVINRIYGRN